MDAVSVKGKGNLISYMEIELFAGDVDLMMSPEKSTLIRSPRNKSVTSPQPVDCTQNQSASKSASTLPNDSSLDSPLVALGNYLVRQSMSGPSLSSLQPKRQLRLSPPCKNAAVIQPFHAQCGSGPSVDAASVRDHIVNQPMFEGSSSDRASLRELAAELPIIATPAMLLSPHLPHRAHNRMEAALPLSPQSPPVSLEQVSSLRAEATAARAELDALSTSVDLKAAELVRLESALAFGSEQLKRLQAESERLLRASRASQELMTSAAATLANALGLLAAGDAPTRLEVPTSPMARSDQVAMAPTRGTTRGTTPPALSPVSSPLRRRAFGKTDTPCEQPEAPLSPLLRAA
jgi:hypothetical protein